MKTLLRLSALYLAYFALSVAVGCAFALAC